MRTGGTAGSSAAFVAALLATGCGGAAGTDAAGTPGAPTRPATKETCPQVEWSPPASLELVQTGRELVGYSPTLLGVETTWAGDGFEVQTVAGGYVDDLVEAYDDLHEAGTLVLADGVEAEVLRGTFLDEPVLVVVWRDASLDVPCDVHAVLVTGADERTETELLRGLH